MAAMPMLASRKFQDFAQDPASFKDIPMKSPV